MAIVNNFDGNIGAMSIAVTALADDGTAVIDFSNYTSADFVAVSESAAGLVEAASATTFVCTVNRTTRIATFQNVTGAAYTGTYKIVGVFY